MENLKSKAQTDEIRIKDQIKSLIERQQFYTEESAKFECEKIGTSCPFIKAINKQHFEKREQEKQKILTEERDLNVRIQAENLDQKLQTLQQELENLRS